MISLPLSLAAAVLCAATAAPTPAVRSHGVCVEEWTGPVRVSYPARAPLRCTRFLDAAKITPHHLNPHT